MYTRKFIAYLDILGFKDLVSNNSHERVCSLYEKLFATMTTIAISGGKTILVNDGDKQHATYDSSNIKVNSLIISDSVVIWTDDNSMKSFVDIIAVLRHLLNYSLKMGLPLRGSLVEGNLDKINQTFQSSKDNSQITLIGLGLVKAYVFESEQEWSGCIIENECIDLYNSNVEKNKAELKDIATLEYLVEKNLIMKYRAPLKTGSISDYYVINWEPSNDLTESFVRERFKAYNKKTSDWKVERILKNTIEFINFCKEKNGR